MIKLTVKQGKKEFAVFGVRSFHWNKNKDLWIYLDDSNTTVKKYTKDNKPVLAYYIPKGKVLEGYSCELDSRYTKDSTWEIMQ